MEGGQIGRYTSGSYAAGYRRGTDRCYIDEVDDRIWPPDTAPMILLLALIASFVYIVQQSRKPPR